MPFEGFTVLIIGFRFVEFFVWYKLQVWNLMNYLGNFRYWLSTVKALMSLSFNKWVIQFFTIFQNSLPQCLHSQSSFYCYWLDFYFSFSRNRRVSSTKSHDVDLLLEDFCCFQGFHAIIWYSLQSVTKNSSFSKESDCFSISCNLLANLRYLSKYCFMICFKILFRLLWLMKNLVFSWFLF